MDPQTDYCSFCGNTPCIAMEGGLCLFSDTEQLAYWQLTLEIELDRLDDAQARARQARANIKRLRISLKLPLA